MRWKHVHSLHMRRGAVKCTRANREFEHATHDMNDSMPVTGQLSANVSIARAVSNAIPATRENPHAATYLRTRVLRLYLGDRDREYRRVELREHSGMTLFIP